MLKDADIREPLFDFLEEQIGKIRIIEEKVIGGSRADVVMITEEAITGIEIKSDADTYARLKSQVKDYDKYYDYNYVVVGTTHAIHIEEHVPEHWGIITVEEEDEGVDFYILRRPLPNPFVKYECQFQLLWRPELAVLQEMNGMPKYKNESRYFVIKKLLEGLGAPEKSKKHLRLSELKRQISEILFERDYNKIGEMLKEYRKGELQKQIDAEEDNSKKLELMMEKAEKKSVFLKNIKRRKGRGRSRRT